MANSFFQIVTPADDTLLVAIGVLRAAAGLAANDGSRDTELKELGKRVSAEVVDACRIAVGEQEDGTAVEPTLRREAVKETFSGDCREVLILSRRHGVKITSITEDGRPVTIDTRGLRSEAGLLYRWVDGRQTGWRANEIVVEYEAGFETVPFSLAGVVVDLVRFRLSQAAVDPLVKSVRVEVVDVETVQTDRWIGATPGAGSSGLPPEYLARLDRFFNPVT